MSCVDYVSLEEKSPWNSEDDGEKNWRKKEGAAGYGGLFIWRNEWIKI